MKYLTLLLTIALLACNTKVKPQENTEETVYFLIRHAEKDITDPSDRDPALTEEGTTRAKQWAEILSKHNVDYVYSGINLSNLWDEIILAYPSGIVIDEVHYDNGTTFPDEDGKSMMLLSPNLDNSLGENWGVANVIFGAGDYGTPGEPNWTGECPGAGDINEDGQHNVLDVVALVNCILLDNCEEYENSCVCDFNGDGAYNVLDIVGLANCVLLDNCD